MRIAALVLLIAVACVHAAAAPPPNVVLIIIDTLRADRVEATRNGVQVMPQLRALAASGWHFRRAIAAASWTKPSVTSVLTGLYPETHGLQRGTRLTLDASTHAEQVAGLPAAKETLATYLKRHGYTTTAVQTNHLLTTVDGFAQGFDTYLELKGAGAQEVNNAVYTRGELLREPFFLYLPFMEPHAPYNPPVPHRDAFGALPPLSTADSALVQGGTGFSNYYLDKLRHDIGLVPARALGALSEAGREYYRAMYDGDCHYVDAQLKRMHEEITRHSPNTIFVVTADHGEEFWEHGRLGHGRSLEQELIHVPMIFFGAGLSPRMVDNTWVEGIDIAPTLAALLGTKPDPHWQGRSLAAEQLESRPVFAETFGMVVEAKTDLQCVLLGNAKLVRDGGGKETGFTTQDGRAVPLLELPPGLAALLDTHRSANKAHPLAKVPVSTRGLDEEMLERLRALGYAAGGAQP